MLPETHWVRGTHGQEGSRTPAPHTQGPGGQEGTSASSPARAYTELWALPSSWLQACECLEGAAPAAAEVGGHGQWRLAQAWHRVSPRGSLACYTVGSWSRQQSPFRRRVWTRRAAAQYLVHTGHQLHAACGNGRGDKCVEGHTKGGIVLSHKPGTNRLENEDHQGMSRDLDVSPLSGRHHKGHAHTRGYSSTFSQSSQEDIPPSLRATRASIC